MTFMTTLHSMHQLTLISFHLVLFYSLYIIY